MAEKEGTDHIEETDATQIFPATSPLANKGGGQSQGNPTAGASGPIHSAYLIDISHDLRSPLNSVIGYSELLRAEADALDLNDFVIDLDHVQQAGQRLLTMIDRMISMARIEVGPVTFELVPFCPVDLLHDVIAEIRPQIEANKNELVLDISDGLGTMEADRAKVCQIMVELLANAAKFTRQGQITLRASRTADNGMGWMCFQISDTGIGMSEAQLQNAFRPFTLVDKSIHRKYGGTGLGLAISHAYCCMMGGHMTAVSQPDQGTTVTVSLPAIVSDPRPSLAEVASTSAPEPPDG